jgi:hypothetical protein
MYRRKPFLIQGFYYTDFLRTGADEVSELPMQECWTKFVFLNDRRF